MSNIKTQISKIIGKSLNKYYPSKLKPVVDDLKFKEEYQGRIIDCMIGEVNDNYITTPETDSNVVKLEHSREGVVQIPSIKGKTILIDESGVETTSPREGCRLISVGEDDDNKLIFLSKNKNFYPFGDFKIPAKSEQTWYDIKGKAYIYGGENVANRTDTWFYLPKGFYKLSANIDNCGFQLITQKEVIVNINASTIFEGGFVCIRVRNSDTTNSFGLSEVMLERFEQHSSVFSSYTPHKIHKTEFLLNEPLRSLPNRVCDEIVESRLIRRTKKYTITGKERFLINLPWETDDILPIYFELNDRLANSYFSSNIFPSLTYSQATDSWKIVRECVRYDSRVIYVFINKNRLKTPNIEGFIDYVERNLFEIIYELAEPIIEELPNSISVQGFDDTTICIENKLTPTVSYKYNALIPFKQEVKSQKEEIEVNTQDIESNIIPFLMDMEYQLMEMEVGDES